MEIQKLESAINYTFKNRELLLEALRHKSYVNEKSRYDFKINSYERLEFLGDAVIELVISRFLWSNYPHYDEGELTKLRAELVKKQTLAKIARSLNLEEFILLGKGERGLIARARSSILADVIESLAGAIFVDSDFDTVQKVVLNWFKSELENLDISKVGNYKNRLQELAATLELPPPDYHLELIEGPRHAPTFYVKVTLKPYGEKVGKGFTKKEAAQEAAKLLMEEIQKILEKKLPSDREEE